MGLGIIAAGSLFPTLANFSLVAAWLGAAFLALIATLIAWPVFASYQASPPAAHRTESRLPFHHRRTLILLAIAYTLFGVGSVPHTLFLVDYVHRELGLNSVVSGMFWTTFGVGSLIGPFCAGFIADKTGIYKSLLVSFLIACVAIALVLFNQITVLYVLSSFLMGVIMPAIVTLLSSRIVELVGTEPHPLFWGKMTLYYAISQALSAYVMSYLLHRNIGYTTCFVIAEVAFLLGFVVVACTKPSDAKIIA